MGKGDDKCKKRRRQRRVYNGPPKVSGDSRKGNYTVRTIFRGRVQAYELKYRWTPEEVEKRSREVVHES